MDPDSPALIGYTSGTTAAPKGVIHTHRTYLADQRTWATFLAEEKSPPPAVKPTGIADRVAGRSRHRARVGAAPAVRGEPARPDGRLGAGDGAGRHGRATVSPPEAGRPYFLLSLLNHPDFDPAVHLPYMDRLIMGGAPVPIAVVRARDRSGHLASSVPTDPPNTRPPPRRLHSDPLEKRIYTDGRIISGSEIQLLDADGRPVAVGEPGEIRSRGPELFVGYTDPALTAEAIDAAGWYDTGDIGVLDEDGYLTITDRKKDIIIRGGENISSAEVENVLVEMAGVAEVAVVAAPDVRYGEHGAAIVRLLSGGSASSASSRRSSTWRRAGWRVRSGRKSCASSMTSRGRRPERSRRTCCAPPGGRAGRSERPLRGPPAEPWGPVAPVSGGGPRGPTMVQKLGGC